MTRIPEITAREQLPADKRAIFDAIASSRGSVRGPFRVLLHAPELAGRIAHTGAYVRFESPLAPRVREMAALATARLLDCEYEYGAHANQAAAVGIPEQTMNALRDRRSEDMAPDDRWVFELVEELWTRHRVSEDRLRDAEQRVGLSGLVEIVGTAGYYAMLAAALNAFDVRWGEG